MYLGTLRADSVRVQHEVCQLLSPVAHIQAPIFALSILVLKVLQLLHYSNVADKLLDDLTKKGGQLPCFKQERGSGQVLLCHRQYM